MAWLKLSIVIDRVDVEAAEAALLAAGSEAVSLDDARSGCADEQSILEPAPGQAPLWAQPRVTALFVLSTEPLALIVQLAGTAPSIEWSRARFARLDDADWTRVWLADFHPLMFGRRTHVVPWHLDKPGNLASDAAIIRLDPGLAFGTGTHPTTALMLDWLDALDLAGSTVIDVGCGSGVLAIAALKLGAQRAIGIDHDPQALTASRDNAHRNGVSERLELAEADRLSTLKGADVVVANILAGTLIELAADIAACVRPGGRVALSGILAEQSRDVIKAYSATLESIEVTEREGWVRLHGRRRSTDQAHATGG